MKTKRQIISEHKRNHKVVKSQTQQESLDKHVGARK